MKQYGAYAAPAWAQSQRTGEVGLKAVLLLLANYADENYSCYPGQKRIADETEQSERTVRRQIEILIAVGLISKEHRYDERGKRTSDRFYLHLDQDVVPAQIKQARAALTAGKMAVLDAKDAIEDPPPPSSLPDTLSGSDSAPTTGHPVTGSDADYRSPATSTTGHGDAYYRTPGGRVTPRRTPRRTKEPDVADATPPTTPETSSDNDTLGFDLPGPSQPDPPPKDTIEETPEQQAFRIAREYLGWIEQKTGVPVIDFEKKVLILRKSYIAGAVQVGATEGQIKTALSNCNLDSVPSKPMWERQIRDAMGGRAKVDPDAEARATRKAQWDARMAAIEAQIDSEMREKWAASETAVSADAAVNLSDLLSISDLNSRSNIIHPDGGTSHVTR